jgi:hypothetical protein
MAHLETKFGARAFGAQRPNADRQFCLGAVGYGSMISIDATSCRSS